MYVVWQDAQTHEQYDTSPTPQYVLDSRPACTNSKERCLARRADSKYKWSGKTRVESYSIRQIKWIGNMRKLTSTYCARKYTHSVRLHCGRSGACACSNVWRTGSGQAATGSKPRRGPRRTSVTYAEMVVLFPYVPYAQRWFVNYVRTYVRMEILRTSKTKSQRKIEQNTHT